MTSGAVPALHTFGDRGLVVEFADELSLEINSRIRALAARLRNAPGVVETVPAFRSLLLVLDPLTADRDRLRDEIMRQAHDVRPDPAGTGRTVEIPVVYGGEAGPDLADVARTHGLTVREAVELHSRQDYLVFMLGFAPGFPYMGILPEGLRTPRLASPRTRVPAGSVAIADALTGIYPLATAGGWRLIGRTPQVLYNPRTPDPVLLRPGDRVRFIPVTSAAFRTAPAEPGPGTPARPALEVRDAGLYTTVQDLGRFGYRSLGVPSAGAMDPLALQLANLLVGNPRHAAAIELTVPGPVLRAVDRLTVAITGADLSAVVDGREVELDTPLPVRAGQTLSFGAPREGVWAYVAVTGGIDVPPVLGSASTYVPGGLGGPRGSRLRAGEILGRGEGSRRHSAPRTVPVVIPSADVAVRFIPGLQDAWFDEPAREEFWRARFAVSVYSDRAGTRLTGPVVRARREVMFSEGMLPGAVQLPSGGQPIVIMPDGPTTGGYPKIGAVCTADLRLVAQARPGTLIRFMPTTVETAVAAVRATEEMLRGAE